MRGVGEGGGVIRLLRVIFRLLQENRFSKGYTGCEMPYVKLRNWTIFTGIYLYRGLMQRSESMTRWSKWVTQDCVRYGEKTGIHEERFRKTCMLNETNFKRWGGKRRTVWRIRSEEITSVLTNCFNSTIKQVATILWINTQNTILSINTHKGKGSERHRMY